MSTTARTVAEAIAEVWAASDPARILRHGVGIITLADDEADVTICPAFITAEMVATAHKVATAHGFAAEADGPHGVTVWA